jgi:hypothetical protein
MEAAHVSRVLRREYHFLGMLYRKLRVARLHDPAQMHALGELAALHYGRPAAADRLRLFLYRALPVWLLALLDAGYRVVRPLCRRLGR